MCVVFVIAKLFCPVSPSIRKGNSAQARRNLFLSSPRCSRYPLLLTQMAIGWDLPSNKAMRLQAAVFVALACACRDAYTIYPSGYAFAPCFPRNTLVPRRCFCVTDLVYIVRLCTVVGTLGWLGTCTITRPTTSTAILRIPCLQSDDPR